MHKSTQVLQMQRSSWHENIDDFLITSLLRQGSFAVPTRHSRGEVGLLGLGRLNHCHRVCSNHRNKDALVLAVTVNKNVPKLHSYQAICDLRNLPISITIIVSRMQDGRCMESAPLGGPRRISMTRLAAL